MSVRLDIKLARSMTRTKKALLEFQMRRVKGVLGALVTDEDVLTLRLDRRETAAAARAELDYLRPGITALSRARRQREEIQRVKEDLRAYRTNAVVSLVGFGLFEAARRLSPDLFASLAPARSAFVLYIAREILRNGLFGLLKDRAPNADTLTSTAVIASLASGRPESSLSLLVLSNFAEMLTISAAEKARQHISSLLAMDEKYVWKVENGAITKIKIDDVRINDLVAVYIGEKICVDGTVEKGSAYVDQSSLTGESVPVLRREGDFVYAGTVLKSGELTVRAAKVGDQTNLARIIHMVENAQNRRAPIQNFADKMANTLVPVSFLSAAVVYAITRDLQRVLNMFFIDFSCGLKLSTSTAISASISRAAQMGVLIKGGNYIEALADIDTIILDKTGTITDGHPVLTGVHPCRGATEEEVVVLAAAAERFSSHPLAEAVIAYADARGAAAAAVARRETVVGRGIAAEVADAGDVKGGTVLVGSRAFMEERRVRGLKSFDEGGIAGGGTLVYVARSGRLLGAVLIEDPIRRNLKRCVNRLRRLGVDEILMLTGDAGKVARYVTDVLDLDGFRAEVLPHEKAEFVAEKQANSKVLMVGDGINDAPALAYADVGVAMGGKSTDIALESADITITSDEPMKLPMAMELSKRTMALVRQNFGATIAINSVAMMLGALGMINPLLATTIHNASTVGVVINSSRILLPPRGRGRAGEAGRDGDF